MNTTKKIVITVISIFCYSFSFAQMISFTPSQMPGIFKDYAENIPYILEGIVVQQSNNSSSELSTCSVIQITKIYKGSPKIKLGTIKVLTNQGGDDNDVGLSKGNRYIIFCKPTNTNTFQLISADNSVTIWCYAHIDFLGDVSVDINDFEKRTSIEPRPFDSLRRHNNKMVYYRPAAQWYNIKYTTLDSINSFFKNNGLKVQEEVGQTK